MEIIVESHSGGLAILGYTVQYDYTFPFTGEREPPVAIWREEINILNILRNKRGRGALRVWSLSSPPHRSEVTSLWGLRHTKHASETSGFLLSC